MMNRLKQSFGKDVDNHRDAIESSDKCAQSLPFLDQPEAQKTHKQQGGSHKLPVFNNRIPHQMRRRTDDGKAKTDQ